jgi:membrane-bound lytic murein transglycosylase D
MDANLKEGVFRDFNPHIKGDRIPAGAYIYLPKGQAALREEKTILLENGAKVIIR